MHQGELIPFHSHAMNHLTHEEASVAAPLNSSEVFCHLLTVQANS
jgi:hypothetical protein